MRQIVGHQEAERREQGQEEGGIARPRARREELRRDDRQEEDGQEDEEINLGETGEAEEPARRDGPPRRARPPRHQPGEHPGHHEALSDHLGHREPREPDLWQRDGRERGREPGGGRAAQMPRHEPQADQAQGREDRRDEERPPQREEFVKQGGQDWKQRGKAGGDRGVGDVGDQEAAGNRANRPVTSAGTRFRNSAARVSVDSGRSRASSNSSAPWRAICRPKFR